MAFSANMAAKLLPVFVEVSICMCLSGVDEAVPCVRVGSVRAMDVCMCA